MPWGSEKLTDLSCMTHESGAPAHHHPLENTYAMARDCDPHTGASRSPCSATNSPWYGGRMQWLLAAIGIVIVVFAKLFLGWGRLKSIPLLPLDVTMDQVCALYDEPEEVTPSESWEGATCYQFQVKLFQVNVTVWEGRVHSISYEFPGTIREEEYEAFLEFYGEGRRWNVLSEGYSYQRDDQRRVSWCSAAPTIGVGTDVFLRRDQKAQKG